MRRMSAQDWNPEISEKTMMKSENADLVEEFRANAHLEIRLAVHFAQLEFGRMIVIGRSL